MVLLHWERERERERERETETETDTDTEKSITLAKSHRTVRVLLSGMIVFVKWFVPLQKNTKELRFVSHVFFFFFSFFVFFFFFFFFLKNHFWERNFYEEKRYVYILSVDSCKLVLIINGGDVLVNKPAGFRSRGSFCRDLQISRSYCTNYLHFHMKIIHISLLYVYSKPSTY